MNDEIVIIGAGIAGLTCAIAFEKLGYKTILFEAASEIKAVGAGIGLAGNAIGALKVLGIEESIISMGNQLNNFPILDQNGKLIYTVSSEKIKKKFKVENFTIHRASLHKILLDQLRSTEIHLQKELKEIRSEDNYYRLIFKDNSEFKTKYLIGADGINSQVRNFIAPNSKIRFAGYDCWRGVIDNTFHIKNGSETWGKNGRFGIVPLANNKVYWFLCLNRKHRNAGKQSKAELMDLFKDYHYPILQIITATSESQILYNPINDLKPQEIYTKNKILLIGDAAHATTPNLGQGACQAIEDVATLYQLILKSDSIEESFNIFAKKRLKRTHFITNTSWKIGKIAQFENPIAIIIRNFIFRVLPSSINNRQLEKIINDVNYDL
ncbi:hypothetical protein BAS09_18200 [Elizabethkingia ursingii]|uniref:FAD-dependent monooxygenase n=1 Tax=Elizabethkingia TaxID=308865 RepID=UPI00099A4C45|nr:MULTISPECIES: FAD-dependent monooxygenase [Elizabethkingia]MCL1688356.1 FAD-dependent monooxygenase [Elizabethkingia anophelis]MCT4306157.1 FAD-dependent monooxygenase [Elizabethkingia anophelis]MDV4008249.1 monooxygenase [Elizabethkingia anophelis]OPC06969.1 hypothetical protein BAS09_18200 [Elizabethkingia ursingii]UTF95123.1 FAD-dependent monooxygenase [Elizabethkingia anophelis]